MTFIYFLFFISYKIFFRQTMDKHFTSLEHAPKILLTIGFIFLDPLKMQKNSHSQSIYLLTPKILSLFEAMYTLWEMIGKPLSRNRKTR